MGAWRSVGRDTGERERERERDRERESGRVRDRPTATILQVNFIFLIFALFFPKLCGGFLFSHLGVSKGGHPLLMTRLCGG